jgi:hypothetical protein
LLRLAELIVSIVMSFIPAFLIDIVEMFDQVSTMAELILLCLKLLILSFLFVLFFGRHRRFDFFSVVNFSEWCARVGSAESGIRLLASLSKATGNMGFGCFLLFIGFTHLTNKISKKQAKNKQAEATVVWKKALAPKAATPTADEVQKS